MTYNRHNWTGQSRRVHERGYYGSQGDSNQNYNDGIYGQGFTGQGNWGQGYVYGNRTNWDRNDFGQSFADRPNLTFGPGGGDQSSYQGVGSRSYQRSDPRIFEDVNERLADDPYLDASDVEVQVKGGLVTLAGSVPSRGQKHMAEDLAETVRGVRDVRNELSVRRT